jgi:O-methyltransferase involved in polyketide biosynthesis
MTAKLKIELGEVQKTLLIPLWGRAVEYDRPDALVKDRFAREVTEKLDFDFAKMSRLPPQAMINCAIRAHHFDTAVREVIARHPDATFINIGAGLDTTFQRVDNGRIHWYDLDLPDSMALRRRLIPETDRNVFIAKSVFDPSWYSDIKVRGSQVFLMAGGVFVYLEEKEIRRLLLDLIREFPGSEIMFETYTKFMVWLRNKILAKGSFKSEVMSDFRWGVGSAKAIAKWDPRIRVLDQFSFYTRLGETRRWNPQELKQFRPMNLFQWIKVVRLKLG